LSDRPAVLSDPETARPSIDGRPHAAWPRLAGLSLAMVSVRVAVGVAVALLADATFPHGPWFPFLPHAWESLFVRWDAIGYLTIARDGYTSLQNHAFLPLYPLATRALSPVFGYAVAGLVVSWLATVLAVWGVTEVTRRYASERTAWLAGTLLLWNPASILLVAAYPEAVLVAAMAWSLEYCLKGRWWEAAVLAALAGATLPQGLPSGVVVALAVLLADRSVRWWLRAAGYGLVSLAGMAGYLLYCRVTTGDALAIRKADLRYWDLHLTWPFHSVVDDLTRMVSWRFVAGGVDTSSQMRTVFALDGLVGVLGALAVVAAVVLAVRDRRLVLVAASLVVGTAISVVTVNTVSDGVERYLLFLAPLYVVAGVCLERLPRPARLPVALNVMLVSAGVATCFGAVYNLGWWFT
jgi:hypothetical protein